MTQMYLTMILLACKLLNMSFTYNVKGKVYCGGMPIEIHFTIEIGTSDLPMYMCNLFICNLELSISQNNRLS